MFILGTHPASNAGGSEYVMYVIEHNNNTGEFGIHELHLDIIKCGSSENPLSAKNN